MGFNFGSGSDSSQQSSRSVVQKDIKGLRKELGAFLSNALRGALSSPGGIYGGFANLLGGAEGAAGWQDIMGGNILNQDLLGNVRSQLLPTAQENIRELANTTQESLGSLGLRFSTDVANITGQGAADIMRGLETDTLNAALPIAQQRAQNIYQMGTDFLPQMLGYGMGFAPVGSFGTSSGSNTQFGASISG